LHPRRQVGYVFAVALAHVCYPDELIVRVWILIQIGKYRIFAHNVENDCLGHIFPLFIR